MGNLSSPVEIGTGTSYINIDKKTGFVVPPEDPKALFQAMKYLIDHPEEAKKMGREAQKRYEEMFTGDRQASAYVKLYHQLLSSQNCKPIPSKINPSLKFR